MVHVSYLVADELFIGLTKRRMDWLGVQYYISQGYVKGRLASPQMPMNDLGWQMTPDDLETVLVRNYRRYKKPMIVTETGVADRNDRYRRWWIAHNIDAIHKAMQRGAKVMGYMHWSLLDNFEWAYGWWPKFGLINVDREHGMKRTPRPSALWFADWLKKNR